MIEYQKRSLRFNIENHYKLQVFYWLLLLGFNVEGAKKQRDGLSQLCFDMASFKNESPVNVLGGK